jgi:hypothetical protein
MTIHKSISWNVVLHSLRVRGQADERTQPRHYAPKSCSLCSRNTYIHTTTTTTTPTTNAYPISAQCERCWPIIRWPLLCKCNSIKCHKKNETLSCSYNNKGNKLYIQPASRDIIQLILGIRPPTRQTQFYGPHYMSYLRANMFGLLFNY